MFHIIVLYQSIFHNYTLLLSCHYFKTLETYFNPCPLVAVHVVHPFPHTDGADYAVLSTDADTTSQVTFQSN